MVYTRIYDPPPSQPRFKGCIVILAYMRRGYATWYGCVYKSSLIFEYYMPHPGLRLYILYIEYVTHPPPHLPGIPI